jgi:hypothetical protein
MLTASSLKMLYDRGKPQTCPMIEGSYQLVKDKDEKDGGFHVIRGKRSELLIVCMRAPSKQLDNDFA